MIFVIKDIKISKSKEKKLNSASNIKDTINNETVCIIKSSVYFKKKIEMRSIVKACNKEAVPNFYGKFICDVTKTI